MIGSARRTLVVAIIWSKHYNMHMVLLGPDDLKKEDLSSGKNQKQSGKGLWNHIFFRFFSLVKVSGPPFITTLVVVLLKKNLCCIQTL